MSASPSAGTVNPVSHWRMLLVYTTFPIAFGLSMLLGNLVIDELTERYNVNNVAFATAMMMWALPTSIFLLYIIFRFEYSAIRLYQKELNELEQNKEHNSELYLVITEELERVKEFTKVSLFIPTMRGVCLLGIFAGLLILVARYIDGTATIVVALNCVVLMLSVMGFGAFMIRLTRTGVALERLKSASQFNQHVDRLIKKTDWQILHDVAIYYLPGDDRIIAAASIYQWGNHIADASKILREYLENYNTEYNKDADKSISIMRYNYHLARAQMLDGRYADAEKTLTEAVEFYKEGTLPFIGLAELEIRRGGSAQVALDYLEQAGDLTHENPLILEPDRRLLKAWVLAALGRRDEAADLLDAVYAEIDKRDAFRMGVYHLYNGYVAHASGDASTAQTEFDRAISYDRQGLITRLAQLASGQIEASIQ